MSKPKPYGMNRTYIPNSKADMRFRKKVYQRGREIAERDPDETAQRRDKRMDRMMEQPGRSEVRASKYAGL